MFSSPDWLGYLAAALTTIAFLPQVIKTWRTKSADDLSLVWLTLFSSGVFCWMMFGVVLRSTPIILANGVTLVLAVVLGILKLRFRR
ncbi:MAG: SemiSWEET transporter [Acidobacteriia bacterium]|nr:SemiSWEET transporter [Terriglobia bacterium]